MILGVFLLMYFVSGYVMIRPAIFGEGKPEVSRRTAAVSAPHTPERLASLASITGQPSPPRRRKDGLWEYRFFRPGYNASLVLSADGNQAEITETRHGWQRTAIGFHRLHGYTGGPLYALWAVAMDLASGSMIVFAFTGVYLWFKLEKRRWPGALILAAGFVYCAFTLAYLIR